MAARSATARQLRTNSHVIFSPRGIDQYAFYFEYVNLNVSRTNINTYTRVLVVDKCVYFYQRDPGKSRTVWRRLRTMKTNEEARDYAVTMFKVSDRNVLMGSPVLAQLEPSDLVQVAAGEIPGVRYRAHGHFKSIYGESDVNFVDRPVNVPLSDAGVDRAIALIAPPTVISPAPPTPAWTSGTSGVTAAIASLVTEAEEAVDDDKDWGDEPY